MARRERFGRLVLLQEREASPLGVEYVAARLGPEGLDRLVSVLRYSPAVSADAEAVRRLTEQARRAARLHGPGLLRLIGVGRVGSHTYVCHELVGGRSLRAVVDRCRRDQFPFSAENALMVASRAAVALDYVHGKKDDGGSPLFHGWLHPGHIVVSYEGEVRLGGLGVWPSLGSTDLLGPEERRCLAPEQAAGGPGDRRSDVHALGRVLLEVLTLQAPAPSDPGGALVGARMFGPGGEPQPLPESLTQLLRRALSPDPGERFADMAEMRKAIDAILFSGDFPSTTFNLAFFMQTIFREEVERDTEEVDAARRADYAEFLPVARSSAPDGGTATAPVDAPAPGTPGGTVDAPVPPTAAATGDAPTLPTPPVTAETETLPVPSAATGLPASEGPRSPTGTPVLVPPAPASPPSGSGASFRAEHMPVESSGAHRALRSRARRAAATRDAANRLVLARPTPPSGERRGLLALVVGLLLAVGVGGGVGYVYFREHGRAARVTPPTTLSPQAAAALARVQELEARIAELEHPNAQAGEQTPEPPLPSPPPRRSEDEAQAAEARARAAAREKARIERERRQAEIRRLEQEKEAAEALLVLEPPAAGPPAPTVNSLPTVAPPPPTPEPPVTTLPPVQPGTLVDANDPAVVAPELVKESQASYPPLAWQLRVEGSVLVGALVDEKGRVTETKILEPSGYRVGFEEAAVRQVKTRQYRPATKNGVPVKIRVAVRVKFALTP
jgi:TonB family protein